MKALSLILCFYVFALTLTPCVDSHAEACCDAKEASHQSEQAPSAAMDMCSPFCTCSCCHVNTIVSSTILVASVISLPTIILSEINVAPLKELPQSIWQPPKI